MTVLFSVLFPTTKVHENLPEALWSSPCLYLQLTSPWPQSQQGTFALSGESCRAQPGPFLLTSLLQPSGRHTHQELDMAGEEQEAPQWTSTERQNIPTLYHRMTVWTQGAQGFPVK